MTKLSCTFGSNCSFGTAAASLRGRARLSGRSGERLDLELRVLARPRLDRLDIIYPPQQQLSSALPDSRGFDDQPLRSSAHHPILGLSMFMEMDAKLGYLVSKRSKR